MFLVTTNKPKRLLYLSFIGHVNVEELERGANEIAELIADWPAGVSLLGDLERLQSMGSECVKVLGKTMEMLDKNGIELVVRVIPDAGNDIGFNILAIFHYRNPPRVVTCKTMSEAARVLSL